MPLRTSIISLCSVLSLQAQPSFSARTAQAEQVIKRFYRGEALDALRERSNREIEAYNSRAKLVNAEQEQAKARMEAAQGPAREAYAQLQELDKGLKDIPDGNDQEGNKRFNARVQARNAQAHRANELHDQAQAAVDAYNALVKGKQGELSQARQQVLGTQAALDARYAAYQSFSKGGQDVAFFIGLNGLLADLRQALRSRPTDAELQKHLVSVRGLRRELALWAMASQARQSNGLVIVEVLVNDEPCWLVVDTGAMDTILSLEVVEAAGLGGVLGKENSLVVVGGQRILGRALQIPRLSVGDQAQIQVEACAVRPCDVGIDGLLGQSYLKAFVYTIDERSPAKLLLKRR